MIPNTAIVHWHGPDDLPPPTVEDIMEFKQYMEDHVDEILRDWQDDQCCEIYLKLDHAGFIMAMIPDRSFSDIYVRTMHQDQWLDFINDDYEDT